MRAVKENERQFPSYLSSSKINKQLEELKVIHHNQSLLEKITRPVTHTLGSFINPYASYYHNANGLKSFLAENLLRHYYNGHQTLGTGTADMAVAKVSRAAHFRSRNNAGPAQRAIAAYEKYLADTPGAKPEWSLENSEAYFTAHALTLPTKLLECLKAELLAKGEQLNLKGDLAAVIYVIQNKCDLNVINLVSINAEISAQQGDSVFKAPAEKSKPSFWNKVNPMKLFSGSSSQEKSASSAREDFLADDGLDSSEEASL